MHAHKQQTKGLELAPDVDFGSITSRLGGYSGDDITNICRDAAMAGMRRAIAGKTAAEIREMVAAQGGGGNGGGGGGGALAQQPVTAADFEQALWKINPSVSAADIKRHEQWLAGFGSV